MAEINLLTIDEEIKLYADEKHALVLKRFFKTGKGQYGEGDIFIGIRNPQCREIAKKYQLLPLKDTETLLSDRVHEKRLIALLILTHQYNIFKKQNDNINTAKIIDTYITHAKLNHINNWDLVDLSAYKILGDYLLNNDRKILYQLAQSGHLWMQRISVVATLAFITKYQFDDILKLAEFFLIHKHDLMHKAVGWMLRETGKKDIETLENFLKKNYQKMPRTMLRYAIEKFDKDKRNQYLKGLI